MSSAIVNSFERDVILKKASGGIQDLINWAQQTPEGKLLPKTTNWTFEACRWELELNGAGTFDDIITLYKNPNDVSATMNYVHVDKSQELFPLYAPGMDISLRWGLFRAPLPFMRDRCATYIEYTKEFTDPLGRRGFARYIRSHALGTIDPRYVRTEIRSWGVVIVETMDPSVLHISSTVDIDWNGNMPTWVSALMTSRRAQSIKNLANVLRASRKLIQKRCGVCSTKPSFLGRQLVQCHDCTKPICGDCRSHHSHTPGASSCWGCASDRSKMFYHEVRFHSKSIVAQDEISPEKFPSFGPTRYSQSTSTWPSIVDDMDTKEPPVDLSNGMSADEHEAILTKASKGMDDLINWAKQTPKGRLLPKTTNWTFEACRHELNLDGAGTLDDLITLYQSSNDMAATMNYVHVDKSQVLFPLDAPGMNISLRLGIFRAPLPFMRDRSATYIEYTKEFVDALGRRGFARYIRSHSLGAVHTSYVRANIRSWGVVIVETNDPAVLHVSSTVDIDWNGNMPTWVATLMTSRRAQSIKNLAAVLRASRKLRLKRCGGCGLKPGFFTRDIQLVACSNCANLMCTTCRAVSTGAVVRCWSCVRSLSKVNNGNPIVILEGEAGNNTPHSCQHYDATRLSEKMSWLSPQNHHHPHAPATEVSVDLSYLRSATT